MFTAVIVACALAPANLGQAEASSVPQPQAPVQAPVAPETLRLPAGTEIEVELVDKLSSNTSRLADKFAIRLVQPISRNGVEIVAAGAVGQGEVIDAAPAGMGGKQGKLIYSARYLDLNGHRVRVRGMMLMGSGKSRVDLATGVLLVPYAGVAAVFIKGGEIEIPAGARATVRLVEDLQLPVHQATESTGNF